MEHELRRVLHPAHPRARLDTAAVRRVARRHLAPPVPDDGGGRHTARMSDRRPDQQIEAGIRPPALPLSGPRHSVPGERVARREPDPMAFRIQPHTRLHEWVADEAGFFRDEGLDYEFETGGFAGGSATGGMVTPAGQEPAQFRSGAFEDMAQGRSSDVS